MEKGRKKFLSDKDFTRDPDWSHRRAGKDLKHFQLWEREG